MQMLVEKKNFPLHSPFVITGYTFTQLEAVWVTLTDGEHRGRGEACGIYYLGETQESLMAQFEKVRGAVEAGAMRIDIQDLLPPGGARNALDCGYWDLECKVSGQSIWQLVGITPHELTTVATIGIGTPEEMAGRALELSDFAHLKVKLDNELPIERLSAIRDARPDAELVIDVNQGWNRELLEEHLSKLRELSVAMVEQPVPRGEDQSLQGLHSPIPIGADESLMNLGEYDAVAPFYDVINIKLDKCGGLTEALEIVKRVQRDGKKLMVGNMTGTSLSMAPSYVIGQFCEFVDIDGPVLLERDIDHGLDYREGGSVSLPSPTVWG